MEVSRTPLALIHIASQPQFIHANRWVASFVVYNHRQ